MGDEIQKFVDVPGGFLYNPGTGMCSYSTPGLWIFGRGIPTFRGCPGRRVTSQLRPLSRRCIAFTAVPGNAILVAVQINRDVAAYFVQPRGLNLRSAHSTDRSPQP